MEGACSTNGGEEDCIWDFVAKAKRDHLKYQDVGGRIMLIWIFER
jgi:hypothetical protein